MVTGIKEVVGCRIVLDAAGEISEIHVTAVPGRMAKQIARDVDTVLKVRGGVDVDHRKIQVAIVEPEAPAADSASHDGELIVEVELPDPAGELLVESLDAEPAAPTPPDQDEDEDADALETYADMVDSRVLYEKLTVTHEQGRVSAAVELRRGERHAVGEQDAADTPDGHLSAVIHATLEALLLLFDVGMNFDTPRFDRLHFGREEVLVVHLEAVEDRVLHSFTGSAVIRQDPRQAAVLATLAATNRLVGRWVLRDAAEFDIF